MIDRTSDSTIQAGVRVTELLYIACTHIHTLKLSLTPPQTVYYKENFRSKIPALIRILAVIFVRNFRQKFPIANTRQ